MNLNQLIDLVHFVCNDRDMNQKCYIAHALSGLLLNHDTVLLLNWPESPSLILLFTVVSTRKCIDFWILILT